MLCDGVVFVPLYFICRCCGRCIEFLFDYGAVMICRGVLFFGVSHHFNYIARNSRSASDDAFALLIFSLGNEITAFCCELCAETLFSIDLTALLFADRTAPSGSISPAPITAVLPTAFPKRLPHTNANIMIIGRATSTSFLFSEFTRMSFRFSI